MEWSNEGYLNEQFCKHRHSPLTHPNCFRNPEEYKPPALLVLDIETLPILAYVWGAYEQNLNIDSIVKDWVVLAWSAKWLGSDKIISDILTSKEALDRNDERLVGGFWKLLDRANVVIGHNSKAFDIRKLNTRFMFHELTPPSYYKHIDTYLAARSAFGMTFNKLDYIASYLELDRKKHTDFSLWVRCDNGDKKALRKMRDYNIQDVKMLEDIYLRIRGWIPNHPNTSLIANIDACPVCLGTYKRIGEYFTSKKAYPEYRCNNCGAIFHGTKSIKSR